ncbi:MAG: hypothetical protein FWF43_05490 [Propionibacteriaceae bacterium]|nr:hypothetical protein [Propionibacteriaceae bacterium]
MSKRTKSVASSRIRLWSCLPDAAVPNTIVFKLNEEWEVLKTESAPWTVSSSDLETVRVSIRSDPDTVLGELITACQAGHCTAGRIIVQALLPKLILMSRVYPYPSVDNLVSALWLRIGRYDLSRRPESVAANLFLDARKDVVAENRITLEVPLPYAPETPELTARDILLQARRLHLATSESLNIVESVYIDGLPSKRVAELYEMTAAAIRRRCCDTVKRLRAHRDLLADNVGVA